MDLEPPASLHGPSQAQPTVILPADLPAPVPVGLSWSEVQTADGRVYYFNSETGVSQWIKPEEIMSDDERVILDTDWKEYKIWDGRSYFFNDRTKCSVWSIPPAVQLARGELETEIQEYVSFDSYNKTEIDSRNQFMELLLDKGVNETHTFTEAVDMIKDDARFSLLPTLQAKQLFFASYISNMTKQRVHEKRDSKRSIFIQAINDWKAWEGMSESVTFAHMQTVFMNKPWFHSVSQTDLRKLFHVFSLEFIEVEKLKKRKLQDSLMHEMKNDILSKLNTIDLATPSAVESIHALYSAMSPQPQFWTYLSDSQKLVVIKSCISQRIRDMRMAIANRLPLSREKRTARQEKDRIKKLFAEFTNSKNENKVVRRGQGVTLPEWTTELEAFLVGNSVDLASAKHLFGEYVDDTRHGRNPLEGIM